MSNLGAAGVFLEQMKKIEGKRRPVDDRGDYGKAIYKSKECGKKAGWRHCQRLSHKRRDIIKCKCMVYLLYWHIKVNFWGETGSSHHRIGRGRGDEGHRVDPKGPGGTPAAQPSTQQTRINRDPCIQLQCNYTYRR